MLYLAGSRETRPRWVGRGLDQGQRPQATRITVSLDYDGQALILEIQDDGVGGARFESGGNGLSGMADRATALGGRLTISSPRLGGTCVRAEIPVDALASRPS